MTAGKSFSTAEARRIGEEIGIDWASAAFDVEQFRMGMTVELEHGLRDPVTDVTHDDPVATGKIVLAHLNEFPDYYTRLERMANDARQEQGSPSQIAPGVRLTRKRPTRRHIAPPTNAAPDSERSSAGPPGDPTPRGDDSVVRWRLDQLLHAGYDGKDADVLARDDRVDLHFAIDLVRRGCPPGTAQRILT